MKTRLNITIENDVLISAKRYATKKSTSLSELIEKHFRTLTRPTRKKSVIDLVKQLPKAEIELPEDLKEAYYEDQKKKHGF